MGLPKMSKIKAIFTCSFVLNTMVIIGFMFNYMLRVNMTIAVVDMMDVRNKTSSTEFRLQETRFNWTESNKNEILGSFFWGYILTELPGGRMAEIIGAKRVFGGGMLAASILTILTPAACYLNYYVLILLRVLLGFSLGATWPAIPPMAAKWIPPMERSKFIAHMMASSLGAGLTMPICGLLIDSLGWASVFYVTGTVSLIWSVLWFFVVYDSPAEHPRISAQERLEIETKISEGEGGKNVKPSKVPWVQIFTSLPVWAIVICHGCSVFGYFTVVNQLPSYMNRVLKFNIKKNGFLSSLPYFGKYLMAVSSSYLADRLRRSGRFSTTTIRKLFTSFAVFFPCFFMALQAFFGQIAAISVTIFTASLFCNGAVTAGYLANGLDIAPNFSGTIMGIANTLSSFGGWLSTKIVGILTEDNNSFQQWCYVFWMLVVVYIVGGVFYLIFGTGVQQKWNSEVIPADKLQEMKPLNRDRQTDVMVYA